MIEFNDLYVYVPLGVGLCCCYVAILLLATTQANVMIEYSIDEALSLLTKNLASAKKMLAQVQEDLNFIRDQTTTTEVSILNNAHH